MAKKQIHDLRRMSLEEIQELSFSDVKQSITNEIKRYARNLERIVVLEESRDIGNGISLDLRTSQISDAPDKLSLVHRKLGGLTEKEYLTERELELASSYKTYKFNKRHSLSLSSKLRELKTSMDNPNGEAIVTNEVDRANLKDLTVKITHVVQSRNRDLSFADRKADPVIKQELEINALTSKNQYMAYAIQRLAILKSQYEELIRLRWIEKKSVKETRIQLDVCQSTYDRWRDDAFEFLANVLYGYQKNDEY